MIAAGEAGVWRAGRRTTRLVALTLLLTLGGCDVGAPSLSLVGAYFPAWILCSLIGLVVGLAVKALLSATRLDQAAFHPLVVCIACAVIAGTLAWCAFYRN
jgi:hypothetical protein